MLRPDAIRVADAKKQITEELGLFEQNSYCLDFIFNKHSLPPEKGELHASISSACFRQAKEFVLSSESAPLATKPLLLSYAFNNYLKGSAHLLSTDGNLLKQFSSHGIGFRHTKDLLRSKVFFKKQGAYVALEKIYSYRITPQGNEIDLGTFLAMIPGLEDMYYKSTKELPLVFSQSHAVWSEAPEYHVKAFMEKYWPSGSDGKPFGLIQQGNRIFGDVYYGIRDLVGEKIFTDIVNDEYVIMPIEKQGDLQWFPPICSSYAVMMAYSMLARYHAEKWYSFIDPSISSSYTLINSSVDFMYHVFVEKIHHSLFDVSYRSGMMTKKEFMRLFKSNQSDIIKIISREIMMKIKR